MHQHFTQKLTIDIRVCKTCAYTLCSTCINQVGMLPCITWGMDLSRSGESSFSRWTWPRRGNSLGNREGHQAWECRLSTLLVNGVSLVGALGIVELASAGGALDGGAEFSLHWEYSVAWSAHLKSLSANCMCENKMGSQYMFSFISKTGSNLIWMYFYCICSKHPSVTYVILFFVIMLCHCVGIGLCLVFMWRCHMMCHIFVDGPPRFIKKRESLHPIHAQTHIKFIQLYTALHIVAHGFM